MSRKKLLLYDAWLYDVGAMTKSIVVVFEEITMYLTGMWESNRHKMLGKDDLLVPFPMCLLEAIWRFVKHL